MEQPEAYIECTGCGWTKTERNVEADKALEKAVELYQECPFCPYCMMNAEICIGLGTRPTVVGMATNLSVERESSLTTKGIYQSSLMTKGRYQVMLGCDLCEVAWYSPIIEDTLETVFAMNEKAFCPECTACGHHEDPDLQVVPVVLKISNLDNEEDD